MCTKFDLAVKYVKVNIMSLFIQTMMGQHPLMLPSFIENGPPVPMEIFFIYGHGGHHGHVTWMVGPFIKTFVPPS